MPRISHDHEEMLREIDILNCDESILVETETSVFKIEKKQDIDPENPRDWDGNLGTMLCWHGRYTLGDAQPATRPSEYLQSMLMSAIRESGGPARLYEWLRTRVTSGVRLVESDGTLVLYEGKDPVDWDGNPVSMSLPWEAGSRDELDFRKDCVEAMGDADCAKALGLYDYAFLPLYLLDHSGLAMRTTDFNDPWDSGQLGWIFTDANRAKALWGEPWNLDRALAELKSEVSVYDKYLQGQVYGIVISEYDPDVSETPEDAPDGDFTETSSCWGFYDAESMLDYVDGELGEYRLRDPSSPEPGSVCRDPVEETAVPWPCPFCGGEVRGRALGPKAKFRGSCTACGASFAQ